MIVYAFQAGWLGRVMASVDERVSQLVTVARARLALDASEASATLVAQKIQMIAAELALEWITGVRRFENQSQQTEHWIGRLYEELYPDEQPDGGRIYSRLELPLPRAQYMARLLLARDSSRWRARAQEEARATLETLRAKAQKAADDKRGDTQFFDVSLTRAAFEQLVVEYDRLAGRQAVDARIAPPRRKSASGALVWFTISAEAVLGLLPTLSGGVTANQESQ